MEACKSAYNQHAGTGNAASTADYQLTEGGIHALKFFYQHPFAQRGEWKYVELTPSKTIQDLLRGQTVIEFPTIFVDIEPSYLPQEETKHCLTSLYQPVKNETDATEVYPPAKNETDATEVYSQAKNETDATEVYSQAKNETDTTEEQVNSHTATTENEENDHKGS
jgi:hypothetical protein